MTQSIENALYLDAITEVTWSELVNASGIPEGELVERDQRPTLKRK